MLFIDIIKDFKVQLRMNSNIFINMTLQKLFSNVEMR